jgi:hypothetical protein
MLEHKDLSVFTRAYVDAIFFTDAGPDADEAIQGKAFPDFAPETVDKIVSDCACFELVNKALLDQAGTCDQNGHDFWLTRNYHGAGFWDRDYTLEVGEALTKAAEAFGQLSLVSGNNGKLYLEG